MFVMPEKKPINYLNSYDIIFFTYLELEDIIHYLILIKQCYKLVVS